MNSFKLFCSGTISTPLCGSKSSPRPRASASLARICASNDVHAVHIRRRCRRMCTALCPNSCFFTIPKVILLRAAGPWLREPLGVMAHLLSAQICLPFGQANFLGGREKAPLPPVANATGGYKHPSPTGFGRIHAKVKCCSPAVFPLFSSKHRGESL